MTYMEVIRIPTKFKFSTLAAKVRFLNLDIHVAVAPRIGHCSAHGSAHVPVLFLKKKSAHSTKLIVVVLQSTIFFKKKKNTTYKLKLFHKAVSGYRHPPIK